MFKPKTNYLIFLIFIVILFVYLYRYRKVKKNEPIVEVEKRVTHYYPLYIPNAQKYLNDKLQLYELDDFMNDIECQQLLNIIKSNKLCCSTYTKLETSNSYNLNTLTDISQKEIIKKLEYRIAKTLGINSTHSEGIQAKKYTAVGQQFKNHHDWFSVDENEYEQIVKYNGNRSWTFMVYLNTPDRGGETHFININKKFKPIRGKALIWNNLYTNGKCNFDTLYAELPPTKGEKYIITKYFKERGHGSKFIRTMNDMLPNYHPIGFEKLKIPKKLFTKIKKWYRDNLDKQIAEPLDAGFLQNANGTASDIVSLDQEPKLKIEIDRTLKPIFEKWSGLKLNLKSIYGIRSYRRGSSLKMHCDTPNTHVISSIIHIGDESDESWPLRIVDNYYREHDIHFEEGDLVLYESARCMHGRPTKYNGNHWDNMYAHYSPDGWKDIVKNRTQIFKNQNNKSI